DVNGQAAGPEATTTGSALEGARFLIAGNSVYRKKNCAQYGAYIGFPAARDCSPPSKCRFSGRDGLRLRQGFPLRQGLRRTSRRTRPCHPNFDFSQDLEGGRSRNDRWELVCRKKNCAQYWAFIGSRLQGTAALQANNDH